MNQENNLKLDNSNRMWKYLIKYLWKDIIVIICCIISLIFVSDSTKMIRALSEFMYILGYFGLDIELDFSIIQPIFYITLFLSVLSLNLCLNIIMKRFKASKDKFEKLIYMSIVLVSIIYCIIII